MPAPAVLCIHLIKSMKEVVSLRALQQWLDRFCYKHPRLGIPGLMRYIVIGNVLVYLLNLFSTNGYPVASALLSFDTSAILQGQVWRIITFIFVPTGSSNIFFFVLTLYFYYFIGSALEREWGSNKFTVFYFFGVILNIILGFFVGTASMYYVNMSMFFAFATLYPNLQFLLFFIIPVKAKWLAWIDAAYFLIAGVRYWPEAAPCPPMPSYLGALRRRFGQEQAAMAAYLAGAEATEDPCLRQLFWDHAQENWDQACRVRALVEQQY